MQYYWEMPRFANGGLEACAIGLRREPHPRLVIIDTLAMVRALTRSRRKQLRVATTRACWNFASSRASSASLSSSCIICAKAIADDAFDTISGTLGLTGAPDTILVLKRESSGHFVLHGRGRDLVEIEKAMSFDRR